MNASSEPDLVFPQSGCLLGIDFGTRRLGISVSNPEQNIASPLSNYSRRSERKDAEYLAELVAEFSVVGTVIGLPIHLSGDESRVSRLARAFADWYRKNVASPVRFWDERMSTSFAESEMRAAGLTPRQRKQRLDMVAAQIMLQSFLDGTRHHRTEPLGDEP